MIFKKESFFLFKNLHLFFLYNLSILILKTVKKSIVLKLPKIYFFCNSNLNSFIFINYYHFKSFIQFFKTNYDRFIFIYFFRLKLKGLGFRVKKICKYLYRFYFIFVNYFYLHLPKEVLIKFRKRRILFISCDFFILQTIITHLLLLKKITAYRRRGLLYPKEIIIMKPGKKRI
jgi:hypothetical protein